MTRDAPLKVLQVTDTLGMGGAETWLMALQRHWSQTGAVKLDFLATSGQRGLFDDEAHALGAEVHYLPYRRAELPAFARGFRRILGQGGYDAIHDHSDYAGGWRYLIGLGALPPVRVSHVHNPLLHMRANYAVSPSRRAVAQAGRSLVLGLATHVCGTSRQALDEYGFTPRRRPAVSVLHCGFDIGKFDGPREADRASVIAEFGFPADARIVLFAGRLDRDLDIDSPRNHKNSWLAVLIARAAAELDPSVRLLMAGAGEAQRAEIEQQIAAWGLADRLRLLGVRTDMGRLMRASDALLFPSAEEGLGMVAVEAQAAGLPVVASTAIPPEAVVIPQLYRAVSVKEPPQRWAAALIEAMSGPRPDPDSCRAALEASSFSIEGSAAGLEAIYGSARR